MKWNIILDFDFVKETDNVIKCYKICNRDKYETQQWHTKESDSDSGWLNQGCSQGEDPWLKLKDD